MLEKHEKAEMGKQTGESWTNLDTRREYSVEGKTWEAVWDEGRAAEGADGNLVSW